MNWQHFQTYNEAANKAFEALCNQLFELWINRHYTETKQSFSVVNGAGGDGGIESYAVLTNSKEIGIQAKWFPDNIGTSQFNQIKTSILTALEVHPNLIQYIVCIPRDLTNLKKGKDGNIVRETEYSKWEKIVTSINSANPKVEIILWGDYNLTRELQYSEADGVRRYWFEKEEISKEVIKYSFDKQKHGWMSQRYISVLHNQGTIHKAFNSFLGDFEECSSVLEELENIIRINEKLINEIGILCDFLSEKKLENGKVKELQEMWRRCKLQYIELIEAKNAFRCEKRIVQWNEQVLNYENLIDIEEWLDKCSHRGSFHHFWDVKVLIEKIRNANMSQLFEKMQERCNFEKIIVLGGQGTGKTHGIANVVERQLEKDYHLPILIQAKSISPQDEWKDIIIRTLGLSQVWSEEELWSALESISYNNEVNNIFQDIEESEIRIVPKVLICIDGIDEMKPYERWNERINQTKSIISRHQRIRFCFTGRSYAFDNGTLFQTNNLKRVYLSDDGDVPVRSIYNQYIKYYNVNDNGSKWLRYSISTPYALKLLCELYKDKHIGQIGKSDITVSNMLQEKFVKLDHEFKELARIDAIISDPIVKIVLLKINEIFEEHSEIERIQIKLILRELDIYCYLNEAGLDKLLDFLEKHSFLQSYQLCSKSFFDRNETIFLLGTQPVYDYLKALRLFERAEYSDELELDDSVLENNGALQMYSIMVMDNFEKILWKNKSCREHLYEEELFSVVAFALVNVNEDISGQYADWLKGLMVRNAYTLSLIVNKVILPLAKLENHPLGSVLLDQCLSKFGKPAYRDMIWSIPTGLSGDDNAIWIRCDDIDFFDESYRLEISDSFNGMPLVWAWGLTSVNNDQRTLIRQEITKWGIARPEEFNKLFEQFVDVNDTQLIIDMFAIAMAVSNICRKNISFLKSISKLIYTNVFQYKKIKTINNAAIRYYSRAIMECAYSEKLITSKQVKKCRPPYRKGTSLLPFAFEATKGTAMNGYKTMDYDLTRYVLCDPLNRLFFSNRIYEYESKKIINSYAKLCNQQDLTSEKWILGIAFGFIKNAGWSDDIFIGKPNGGKQGESIGVDIAICRKYWPATHGSLSTVMSITEKYVWCAKMELLGYLADRLPYRGYEYNDYLVRDYGQLEDYVNPYQELCQVDLKNIMEETNWILPEKLTSTIEGCNYDKVGIQKWLLDSPIPDFKKWINMQRGSVALYGYHHISNEIQGVETTMWISSGLINKGTMPSFLKKVKHKDFNRELINVSDIYAYPASDCYVSPLEVCWFEWKDEYASSLEYGKNMLHKNVARCICNIQGRGEVEYMMPSKIVRKLMGIMSGDGCHYYDNEGVEIANFRDAGESYGDCQHILLVNEDIFNSKVDELNFQPVWFIRVLKEISSKARERLDCFMEVDETYLIWKSSNQWKVRKIEYDE